MGSDHQHRICTYREAEETIRSKEAFYVNDCFCRGPAKAGEAKWDYCGCPIEVCMGFYKPPEESGIAATEIPQEHALELFEDWKKRGNLFRFMEDDSWICFCCKCGCGFFRDEDGNLKQDSCDKSAYIEKTDMDKCNLCGLCIDSCAYGARSISGDKMLIEPEKCWGCSACEFICPEDAITMAAR
jgi:ferredoxin